MGDAAASSVANTAKRRRDQRARQTGRHVHWLCGLLGQSGYHTLQAASEQASLRALVSELVHKIDHMSAKSAQLEDQVAFMQILVATLRADACSYPAVVKQEEEKLPVPWAWPVAPPDIPASIAAVVKHEDVAAHEWEVHSDVAAGKAPEVVAYVQAADTPTDAHNNLVEGFQGFG